VTGGGSLAIIRVNGDEEVGTKTVCCLVVCCVCLRHETEARVVHLRFYPPSQVSPVSDLICVAEPLGLEVACVDDFAFACLYRQFPTREPPRAGKDKTCNSVLILENLN
jgi:hypothetical protein